MYDMYRLVDTQASLCLLSKIGLQPCGGKWERGRGGRWILVDVIGCPSHV